MGTAIKTAVILAGGKGLRLRPLTDNLPKPMIKILGKPVLQWTVEWFKKYGIKKIVMGVAYKKNLIIDYFGDGSKFGVNIEYSEHTVEGGTAEGFFNAITRFVKDKNFIAMNGDELSNLDINKLSKFHFLHKPIATIVVSSLKSPFGVITVDKDNSIISFTEKPIIKSLLISTGIYVFNKKIVDYLSQKGSVEKDTFLLLVKNKMLKAYYINEGWITVNNLKDLQNAEKILASWGRI